MNYCLYVLSYIFGSISGSILLSKKLGTKDPRTHGSKNPGASNVYRLGYKKLAVVTFLFDGLKGAIPLYLLIHHHYDEQTQIICGFFAILGHCYPIFTKFKGGKGMSTAFGVLMAREPLWTILQIGLWLQLSFAGNMAALSSLILLSLNLYYFCIIRHTYEMLPMIVLIAWRHRENIYRMVKRKEIHLNAP